MRYSPDPAKTGFPAPNPLIPNKLPPVFRVFQTAFAAFFLIVDTATACERRIQKPGKRSPRPRESNWQERLPPAPRNHANLLRVNADGALPGLSSPDPGGVAPGRDRALRVPGKPPPPGIRPKTFRGPFSRPGFSSPLSGGAPPGRGRAPRVPGRLRPQEQIFRKNPPGIFGFLRNPFYFSGVPNSLLYDTQNRV